MKLPARFIVPFLIALLCAGGIIGFLWWQVAQSTEILRNQEPAEAESEVQAMLQPLAAPAAIVGGDASLQHLRQGDLFALQGDWQNAHDEYNQAVQTDGGLPALRKLAEAQLQLRDLKAVRATIRDLRARGARNEDLLLLETVVDLRQGELVQARERLIKAADSPQREYGLALLSIIEGNHQKSQEHLGKVRNGWEPVLRSYAKTLQSAYDEYALFPASPEIHLVTLLARALAQVRECELALPLLVQVTNQKTDYRDAWIVQGYCELTTARPEQALTSLEQAYTIDPQKAETQYFLGRTHAAMGNHADALVFFEYAASNGFEPQEEIRRHIAKEALLSGNAALALEQYAELLQTTEADAELYQEYISSSLALDRPKLALQRAREAVGRWPNNAALHELLGRAAYQTGDTEQAKQSLRHALELDPYLTGAEEALQQIQAGPSADTTETTTEESVE